MDNRKPLSSDSDIRQALRHRLFSRHTNSADFLLIEELGICRGSARIDMLVVNSSLEGYEIKSDRDSLHRLEHQVELYSKVLDRATIVVGERHLTSVLEIVPDWWGVLLFTRGPRTSRIKLIRRPKKNVYVDSRALVELLWHNEAIAFLEERSAARGVRGKPRKVVWDRVCHFFKTREIAARVRTQLRVRKGITDAAPL